MWSPMYTGTALSESPANQDTVRLVESGSRDASGWALRRSEEHTSELQSHSDLHAFPTRRLFRAVTYVHRHSTFGESREPGYCPSCRIQYARCIGLGLG